MPFRTFALAALLVLPLGSVPAFAEVPPEFAGRGCMFYDNENATGFRAVVDVTRTDDGGRTYNRIINSIGNGHDNNISAVQCNRHCSTALYDQPNRQGGEILVFDGQSGLTSLAGNPANNRTSSLAVFCAKP